MSENILIDEDHQKQLNEKGYAKMPLLSQQEVATLMSKILALHPDNKFHPNGDNIEYMSYHISLLEEDIGYKNEVVAIISEAFTPHLERIFGNYELFASSFFIKPPGLGELPPHQHFPLTANTDIKTVVVWCPLIDVNEVNGTLKVIEGSHKINPGIFAHGMQPFFAEYIEEIKKYGEAISLRSGECIIFDDKLIHWSDKNKSELPRITATGLCVPVNVDKIFFHIDSADQRNLEAFKIDRSFFVENRITRGTLDRPEKYESIGFAENNCPILSQEDFVKALNNGDEIRHEIILNREKLVSEKNASSTEQ